MFQTLRKDPLYIGLKQRSILCLGECCLFQTLRNNPLYIGLKQRT